MKIEKLTFLNSCRQLSILLCDKFEGDPLKDLGRRPNEFSAHLELDRVSPPHSSTRFAYLLHPEKFVIVNTICHYLIMKENFDLIINGCLKFLICYFRNCSLVLEFWDLQLMTIIFVYSRNYAIKEANGT